MRTVILNFLLLLSFPAFSQGFGEQILINDNWSFHLGDLKYGGRESLDYSEWRKLDLPHDWSVEGTASPDLASCTGYLPGGIAWYRKDLNIPANRKGQKLYIYFGGVYNKSEVFINGKWLGKRPNGYISFMYDLTPYINFGETNKIAVRVDHSDYADSRWYTGSGIYRDVHLVYANPVHIDLWGVSHTAAVKGNKATVKVETRIVNHTEDNASQSITVIQEIWDKDGKKLNSVSEKINVDSRSKLSQALTLTNPKLWSVDEPNLYTLKTTLKQNNKTIDENEMRIGIRTLDFDPDKGFSLNGESMKFKGVCIHHDAGCLGSAVPKEVWKRRLIALKELGCNAIRTSHNPQATDLYDLCDELGFLVMDEAFDEWEYPKKKWIEGWNKGEPGFQGSADYFREWSKRDLADQIRRDRNHPSIIMWSIGNEVDYPNDPYTHPVLDEEGIGQIHTSGYQPSQPNAERLGEIARELVAVVKEHDQSRPVTAALAGAIMSNFTDYPYVLDVVGYNYTENRYQIDHEKYPDRILYGSENRRGYEEWKAVADNDFIMGQFLWTGLDYLGEAGAWPSRGFTTGLLDLAGYPKPQAYFHKSLWSEKPMAYVGSYRPWRSRRGPSIHVPKVWNHDEGDTVRVVCYTNCDEAEIFINGKQAGERKPYDNETGIIYWDIPYEPGKLVVKTYNGGQLAATDSVETVGRPVKIKAIADKDSFTKKGEVAHIEIEMVDDEGRLVPFADTELRFRTNDNLELLGTENGSGDPTDNYRDRVHRCLNGKLLVYVKVKDPEKESRLQISAPLFETTEVSW